MGSKYYTDADKRLYEAVGKRITSYRMEVGMTRAAVEALAGMRSGYLAHLEAADTMCPLHVLAQLAEVFDCTLDDLVPVMEDQK